MSPQNKTTPEKLRRRLGTHMVQTRERMRTTPRVILIPRRAITGVRCEGTQARTMPMTWWQEFTRKSHIAPPVYLQASRRETILPVSRNSTLKICLRRSKQTNVWWPFSNWQTITVLQTFITISIEFPSCQSRSPQRCPRLTGIPRSSSCLKT